MSTIVQYPYDVFISYSSQDAAWVRGELLPRLDQANLKVIIDFRDFEIGVPSLINMERAVDKSRHTLVVLTPNWIASEWTEFESLLVGTRDPAGHRRKLIPLMIQKCDLPARITMLTYLDLTAINSIDEYMPRLIKSLLPPTYSDDPEVPWHQLHHALNELPEMSPDISNKFSQSVQDHMATLNRKVDSLTHEQFRVIRMLSGEHRVRISGCAGSGKTLVAAEKAIRLSHAGIKTLFLCHNPLLADYVEHITRGSGVYVAPFGAWVTHLAGISTDVALDNWTNYEEPDDHTIGVAFDVLTKIGPRFDAIVVDEGQDFRDEWWTLVEAGLAHGDASILYIFHDDYQALLPHRSIYPISRPTVDLSRNCRNAGKIYTLMNFFHPPSLAPEAELSNHGEVMIRSYAAETEKEEVEKIVRWIIKAGYGDNLILLLGGTQSLETSSLLGTSLTIPPAYQWQEAIQGLFERWIYIQDPRGVTFPSDGGAWVKEQLRQLSTEPVPDADDVKLVCRVAGEFSVDHSVRYRIKNHPRFRDATKWVIKNDKLQLQHPGTAKVWAAETILHFETEDWVEGPPQPRVITLKRYFEQAEGDFINVFNVADYKGLESDVIVLVMRGKVPQIKQQLYVGISRARYLLALLVDRSTASVLPVDWLR